MNSKGLQFLGSVLMFAVVVPQTQTEATPRDLSVFGAVIEQKIRRGALPAVDGKSPGQWLVVFDRTYPLCDAHLKLWCMPSETLERLEEWLAQTGGDVALLKGFAGRNREAAVVGNPDPEATFVAASGPLETLGLSNDFWTIFRARYPGTRGWARFSAPAYSDTGDAVVFVTFSCGGLCGEGWLIRLSPVGSGWRMTNWVSVWGS